MTAYEWGSPYWVLGRGNVAPSDEHIHGRRYELVYDFETDQPLSLHQAEVLYGQILANPDIPTYTKIRYFRVEQSSTVGQIRLQYESLHPIALTTIIVACIAAFVIAATVALIVFVVVPTLTAAYILMTTLLELPKPIAFAIVIGVAGVVGYVGYKLVIGKPLRPGGVPPSSPRWSPEEREGFYG